MSEHQGGRMKVWRISTVRQGWRGGTSDLSYTRYTRSEAESLAAALNEAYPEYRHRAAYVRGDR